MMKNLTMDELRERYTNEACFSGNLFRSAIRTAIADEAVGLMAQNGKMRVKEIMQGLTFDTTPQMVTAVLRNLAMMGKVKREEVRGEPITVTSFSFRTGKDETREVIPTIGYYSLV